MIHVKYYVRGEFVHLCFLFVLKVSFSFKSFFFSFINLFILFYFWLRWVLVAARRFSLVVVSGGYSLLWCAGFSLWWLLLLWSTGSRAQASVVAACGLSSCGMWALERRLSSCGARA